MARPVYLTLTGAGSTPAQLANYNAQPFQLTISVTVTGTVNYTIQYSYDDVFGLPNPSSWSPTTPNPTWLNDPVVSAVTTSAETTFNDPIQLWRVTINSGDGSLAIVGIQSGIVG